MASATRRILRPRLSAARWLTPTLAVLALALSAAALAAGIAPLHPQSGPYRVRVSGTAGQCPVGDPVMLLSKAFSHRHDFALPAVFTHERRPLRALGGSRLAATRRY